MCAIVKVESLSRFLVCGHACICVHELESVCYWFQYRMLHSELLLRVFFQQFQLYTWWDTHLYCSRKGRTSAHAVIYTLNANAQHLYTRYAHKYKCVLVYMRDRGAINLCHHLTHPAGFLSLATIKLYSLSLSLYKQYIHAKHAHKIQRLSTTLYCWQRFEMLCFHPSPPAPPQPHAHTHTRTAHTLAHRVKITYTHSITHAPDLHTHHAQGFIFYHNFNACVWFLSWNKRRDKTKTNDRNIEINETIKLG